MVRETLRSISFIYGNRIFSLVNTFAIGYGRDRTGFESAERGRLGGTVFSWVGLFREEEERPLQPRAARRPG